MDAQDISQLDLLLCFVTCLSENSISSAAIAGYIAAVKHHFVLYGFSLAAFQSKLLYLLQKSLSLNAPLRVRRKGIIDINLLQQIVYACEKLQYPYIYKSIFLLAFFTFLRISNFAPLTTSGFDSTRHLTRGDLVWGHPGAHLIVKWAKNMQGRTECHVIQIPLLNNKLLCPVTILHTYFRKFPAVASSPMFVHPITMRPITQNDIRQALAQILIYLNIPQGYITFHCFRRSGATFCFNHNLPLQNIKHHGGWKSNAVWLYLTQAQQGTARVAATFSQHIL